MRPCQPCLESSGHPTLRNPPHLVNPQTGAPGLFDIYGYAVCPACRAIWERRRNDVELVG